MPEVFWFKVRNPSTGHLDRYPKKAVASVIARLGGEKVWGSIEEVHDDDLDPDGFYEQPRGRLGDLTPENRALVERLRIDIDNGRDWDRIDLTGHDLNRLLNAARDEAGAAPASGQGAVYPG
jgi:hypothetical protein